ncbi:MAG: hypothetical protein P4L46_01925 [Fimbriimonas sp.]|nr:hypothetical protein [Fimbriimonas sp.]
MSDLDAFLAPYPAHVRHTMLDGRGILLKMLEPVGELHYDATSAVCAGFSYTGDLKGLFVNLAAYSDHVTLVFAHGAKLIDIERKLNGKGAQVRHLRLGTAETLRDPYVQGLIVQAAAQAPRPDVPIEYGILVKVYDGPKRRP